MGLGPKVFQLPDGPGDTAAHFLSGNLGRHFPMPPSLWNKAMLWAEENLTSIYFSACSHVKPEEWQPQNHPRTHPFAQLLRAARLVFLVCFQGSDNSVE